MHHWRTYCHNRQACRGAHSDADDGASAQPAATAATAAGAASGGDLGARPLHQHNLASPLEQDSRGVAVDAVIVDCAAQQAAAGCLGQLDLHRLLLHRRRLAVGKHKGAVCSSAVVGHGQSRGVRQRKIDPLMAQSGCRQLSTEQCSTDVGCRLSAATGSPPASGCKGGAPATVQGCSKVRCGAVRRSAM
jgi:hypothetical protein